MHPRLDLFALRTKPGHSYRVLCSQFTWIWSSTVAQPQPRSAMRSETRTADLHTCYRVAWMNTFHNFKGAIQPFHPVRYLPFSSSSNSRSFSWIAERKVFMSLQICHLSSEDRSLSSLNFTFTWQKNTHKKISNEQPLRDIGTNSKQTLFFFLPPSLQARQMKIQESLDDLWSSCFLP